MGSQSRRVLQNRLINNATENTLLNTIVPVLVIPVKKQTIIQ